MEKSKMTKWKCHSCGLTAIEESNDFILPPGWWNVAFKRSHSLDGITTRLFCGECYDNNLAAILGGEPKVTRRNVFTFERVNVEVDGDNGEPEVTVHTLPILEGPFESFDEMICDLQDFIDPLECKYGVHDISFSPDEVLFGFTSYEIEEKNWPIVLTLWKEKIQELGFVVGEWYIDDE